MQLSFTMPSVSKNCHDYYSEPPSQPELFLSHSTICSGASTSPARVWSTRQALSASVLVEEKAQQDPQSSCDLTAPTQTFLGLVLSSQEKDLGGAAPLTTCSMCTSESRFSRLAPRKKRNSSVVLPANWSYCLTANVRSGLVSVS